MEYVSVIDIVVFALGLLFLGLWLYLYFKGRQYQDLFAELDKSDFPMGDTYFVGYMATLILKLEYKDRQAKKLRKELSVLYEPKYADYYLRVIYSMQYTMALTVACFAAPLYFATGSLPLYGIALAGAGLAYYYYGVVMEDKIKKRNQEMLSDFSEVVSKLALLVSSGMILNEAWSRVSESGDHSIYQEMRKSVVEMRNGMPMGDALYLFGQRCMLPEIRKFSSTLVQGLNQGNAELAPMLTQQSKEVWELKKQLVRRAGEAASNLLLLPMSLTFIGILIMIIIPIFSNLGG